MCAALIAWLVPAVLQAQAPEAPPPDLDALDDERPPPVVLPADPEHERDEVLPAYEDEGQGIPPRVLLAISAGLPLRLVKDIDLGQKRVGPGFADAFAAFVFLGERPLRHGLGMGVSSNITTDGGFTEPVDISEQWVLTPSYVLYLDISRDYTLAAHGGIPMSVMRGSQSWGVELAAMAGYRLSAGAGLFAEVSFNAMWGLESQVFPLASLELGAMVDYEVLP